MSDELEAPALGLSEPSYRCSLCLRTFGKESTRKRHHYYCRSKPSDAAVSRRRSCAACVRAKTRCIRLADEAPGPCLRCTERGVKCDYDGVAHQQHASDQGDSSSTPNSALNKRENTKTHSAMTAVASPKKAKRDGALELSVSSISHEKTELALLERFSENSWDARPSEIDILDLGAKPPENYGGSFKPNPSHNAPNAPNAPDRFMTGTSFFAPWSPPFSGPPSFNQRSFTKCSQAVLVSLAMQILRSYPHMIVQKGMLPPFISPIQYSWTETGQGPPQQALINCISLVQMFRSRTETNKIFVWRLIKLEQERILEEHNELDQWELLASLQALLIYSLLRLQDTPTSPDVFDFSLLATVSMVATRLALSVGCADCNLPQNADEAWSEWIFIECRRRTVLIFQIINMLVEMSTAISYYTADLGGFALVPLASSAGLFNAQDIECWRTEFELRYKRYTVYGISQAGLLTKLQHNGTECRTSTEDWAEWSADVGAIGNLVMIVGSLLSDRYRSLTPSELMAIPSSILGFAAPSRMDTTFPAGAALG